MQSSILRRALIGLAIILTTAALFWPGVSGGFFLDDFPNIVNNPRVQAESLNGEAVLLAARAYEAGGPGRPLATISFAVNYAIGGKDPFGYKVANVALHSINAILVFLLVRIMVGISAPCAPRDRDLAAGLTTLAWAGHPLQVSTVLYVVQRMEMLAATFLLLSVTLYIVARLRQNQGKPAIPLFAAALLAFSAGLFAKETVLVAAPLLLALEITLLRFRTTTEQGSRKLKVAYAAVAAVGCVFFFAWLLPRFAPPESFEIRSFTQWERQLTQLRVLPYYVLQIVLPAPDMMPVYYDDFPKSTGLLTPPTTMFGLFALLAAICCAWVIRISNPLASLGILWFLGAHALTSSPLNLELAFEHRNYVPLLGIALCILGLMLKVKTRDGPAVKLTGAVIALSILCGLTTVRSATWGNQLLLAADLAARAPHSQRASNDLAVTYVNFSDGNPDSPFIDFAVAEFERGRTLEGPSPFAEQGLILLASMRNQPAKAEWWDGMLRKIQAGPTGPETVLTVVGMLNQHRNGFTVDSQKLAKVFEAMIGKRNAWPGHVHANFADFLYEDLAQHDRATYYYVRAVVDNPNDREFAQQLLGTLVSEGRAGPANAVADAMSRAGLLPAAAGKGTNH